MLLFFSFLAGTSIFSSCANQKPPGGGEEDKIPPKLLFQSPKSNSVNFKGKSLIFEFDEYVDRRSFQEAFHLSPPYNGEITFEWSGKEVEIIFETSLWKTDPNKTFVVTMNSALTDVRGNKLISPISYAFSTGSKIDMAAVSGKVINAGDKAIIILAYKLGMDEAEYNPAKITADYFTETSSDGSYSLTNLSPGKYRIIAIDDEDRNMMYTVERENYGVLPNDISLVDSVEIKNCDFFLKIIDNGKMNISDVNISEFFKDSLDIVYSSIENDSRSVLPNQSIFIFFNKYKPGRENFVNSFSLKDNIGNPEKIVYNWRNDSLVEIIAPNDLVYNKDYKINFKINTEKDSVYTYILLFRTVSSNSFGEVKGLIRKPYEAVAEKIPVHITLSSFEIKPEVKYSFTEADTVFNLKNIFEADYNLFSFIDKNFNGMYNYGNPYPFEFSEQFFVYPQKISAKGGWAIENVVINFLK